MWSGAVTDTEHAQRSYFTVARLSVPLSKGFGHGIGVRYGFSKKCKQKMSFPFHRKTVL